MPEADKQTGEGNETRRVAARDPTRPSGRLRPPGATLVLHVGCALRLHDDQWLRALSSAELGEAWAKAIAVAIRKGVSAADHQRRGDLPEGVVEVEFEYRGGERRFSQVFLPKLQRAIGDFLAGAAPRSDRRRLEGSLVRLRLSPRSSMVGPAHHETGATAVNRGGIGVERSSSPGTRIAELIDHIRSLSKSADRTKPLTTVLELQAALEEIRRLLGDEAAAVLNCFAGERYDFETSKALASGINQAARNLGLQFLFTAADGVERHAYLRCQATGRDRQPTFQFQSTADDGTRSIHAASRTLPSLKIAASAACSRAVVSGR